jgi:serine/threonine-protein kinase
VRVAVSAAAAAEPRTVPPPAGDMDLADAELPQIPGYVLLGELGRGGMGVVYKARHVGLKRLVALKMILVGSHAGPAELSRFRTEAEAVARLQHPNFVNIYDIGESERHPYVSLEFVEGGSLADQLTGKPWPVRKAAVLVETLARAMHHAHRRNIVHRDLKPANVLMATDGTPKISDFGLAKQLDAEAGQTASNAILGTPSYMAPEQAGGQSKRVGPAADVYALGAILYELLTGQRPFQATTPLDTILQVLSEDPVPPRELRPKVPVELETICLKCLRKEPPERYLSALALADDLRRFLDDQPIRAQPTRRGDGARKWIRQNLVLVIFMGLIAVLFLVSLLQAFW